MYPDCHTPRLHSNRPKIRLKYLPNLWGQVHSETEGELNIAQTQLVGSYRIFKTGKPQKFVLDTGSPFTIISYDVWLLHKNQSMKPELVSWGDEPPSTHHKIPWGSTTLQGEFHWVDLELREFGRDRVNDPVVDCRMLAFCLTQFTTGLPPVLLGLGCQGIESQGLCLNLGKGESPDKRGYDAWLIDLSKGTGYAP